MEQLNKEMVESGWAGWQGAGQEQQQQQQQQQQQPQKGKPWFRRLLRGS